MAHHSSSHLSPELEEKMVVGFWDGWSFGSSGWGCLPGVCVSQLEAIPVGHGFKWDYGGIQLLDLTLWANIGKWGDKGREKAVCEISLPFNFSWHKLKIFLGENKKKKKRITEKVDSWLNLTPKSCFASRWLAHAHPYGAQPTRWLCLGHAARIDVQHDGRCVQGPGPISSPAEHSAAAGERLGCREAHEMFDGYIGMR